MTRFVSARKIVAPVVSAVVFGLVYTNALWAISIRYQDRADGTLTSFDGVTMEYSGQGLATYFGRYTVMGRHDVNEFGEVLNGRFTTTTTDGDSIAGNYTGTFTPLPNGQFRFNVTVHWLPDTGTGRLAGVSGQADVVAILGAPVVGAPIFYTARGMLNLP